MPPGNLNSILMLSHCDYLMISIRNTLASEDCPRSYGAAAGATARGLVTVTRPSAPGRVRPGAAAAATRIKLPAVTVSAAEWPARLTRRLSRRDTGRPQHWQPPVWPGGTRDRHRGRGRRSHSRLSVAGTGRTDIRPGRSPSPTPSPAESRAADRNHRITESSESTRIMIMFNDSTGVSVTSSLGFTGTGTAANLSCHAGVSLSAAAAPGRRSVRLRP